ncbi:MAG: glycoside hydrolase 100 family protein [archaeon]
MEKKGDVIDIAYKRAVEVLHECSTKNGFFASGGARGYNAVWARDSMITSLGASLIPNHEFEPAFRNSLITLAKNQSDSGEIPNAVDKFSKRKPHVDFKSIDSSLWYVIGHYVYAKRFNKKLFRKYKKSIEMAYVWLKYQASFKSGMLKQLPTTDWQDAFPHKYGYTINSQALYYKVLRLFKKHNQAKKLKLIVNKNKDDKLWNKEYYYAYRWKNHNKYKELGDWFDSLGNSLAIVFDLATESQAKKIISFIEKKKINKPFPIRTIYPPINKKSKYWKDYFLDAHALPNKYSNGGIWGYNGCFYILSLIKYNKFKQAEIELRKLAEVNVKADFPEWTHPITKKSFGKLQAWEAGMYILAYESLKKEKVLI